MARRVNHLILIVSICTIGCSGRGSSGDASTGKENRVTSEPERVKANGEAAKVRAEAERLPTETAEKPAEPATHTSQIDRTLAAVKSLDNEFATRCEEIKKPILAAYDKIVTVHTPGDDLIRIAFDINAFKQDRDVDLHAKHYYESEVVSLKPCFVKYEQELCATIDRYISATSPLIVTLISNNRVDKANEINEFIVKLNRRKSEKSGLYSMLHKGVKFVGSKADQATYGDGKVTLEILEYDGNDAIEVEVVFEPKHYKDHAFVTQAECCFGASTKVLVFKSQSSKKNKMFVDDRDENDPWLRGAFYKRSKSFGSKYVVYTPEQNEMQLIVTSTLPSTAIFSNSLVTHSFTYYLQMVK